MIDFNDVDQHGRTQLHDACYYGYFEVVKFLKVELSLTFSSHSIKLQVPYISFNAK